MNIEEFRKRGYEVVDYIAKYYQELENFPTLSNVQPGYLSELLPSEAPSTPEDFDVIMKDFNDKIIPGITHWQSPNYFAYFPANSSFPSILGDMLSNMVNCIGFNWICSPACTELETIVMDWLAKMISLPERFLSASNGGGVIQGTASESVLVTLIAAREKKIRMHNSLNPDLLVPKFVAYCSDQTHSSVQKAAIILRIKMHVISSKNFSMDDSLLEETIKNDIKNGLVPIFVCSTIGTTSTGGIDKVEKIAGIAKKYKLWHHVDAAYAGSALVCPEFQYLLEGVENADSFSMNCHKWLLTNFDFSPLWIADRSQLIKALSINPAYLENNATSSGKVCVNERKGKVIDYRDWQIGLGRRFRSLKFWFVARCYGVSGLQTHIRKCIDLAKLFEHFINEDPLFEVAAERTFSLVCFRVKNLGDSEHKLLNDNINSCGVFLTHTVINNLYTLRLCVGSPWTEENHIHKVFEIIKQETKKIKKGQ
ncbi:aromatic-L-amino-acid decarboxylase [Rozella allomycis CSF55]|uniref:Aromatic-L-amino-acid decarboxylase n=1 Tax=Rozella allomycis (strain CSF55) TaxID=988480 RepID=A0A075ATZ3_ROZAC|nr:Pyridoxal phosphate-dependent transferase domain-containing protein 7 [Rozella allomycis CSF55]RKP20711.1 aromatic-L-amino-acid decarboxylase [Rozella allomycis CSF55]|eukprot:EPZ33595.1 Pyridoxal phosphate-dependent transferase domain-containing protein 7 [Rozella allomycis CSF55]